MSRFLLFFLCCASAQAQKLEHFDLLMFNIGKFSDSAWHLTAPRFASGFNPAGYNNQPQFFGASEIYLSAQFPSDTTQTDIVSLDPILRTWSRVTQTREAEYSPTPMPDGKRFSCIRVESDGTQRLWSFPLDRSDAGRVLFPKIKGVGYHCWLADTLCAMFIVGEGKDPHTLVLVGQKSQKPIKIASNIGRSLHRLTDGRLVYVHKTTEQTWFLKTYDPKKQASEILVKTPAGSEDLTVLPDGSFLMGLGSKLMHFRANSSATEWKEIADLEKFGVRKITRLAINKSGKLALIVQSL